MSDRREQLLEALNAFSDDRLALLETQINALESRITVTHPEPSFVDGRFGQIFGDVLMLHHAVSWEPFTKDKFEYALVRVARMTGLDADKAEMGNPGYDIKIGGQLISLKTQANKAIKESHLHISKFMELGKGAWETENDVVNLRAQMLSHLDNYDRILSLRCLHRDRDEGSYRYELVEIPTDLLRSAEHGVIEMKHDSTQTPKPAVCSVYDGEDLTVQLYFDGGTERKLQIRKLSKAHCRVLGNWEFVLTGPQS